MFKLACFTKETFSTQKNHHTPCPFQPQPPKKQELNKTPPHMNNTKQRKIVLTLPFQSVSRLTGGLT
uniref:Putative ovule protein n=1 Tax=Solanum chacoense TaxID=4108 RepID=A0A0V0H5W7_SOLCH